METITINGEEYVKKDSINMNPEIITYNDKPTVAKKAIGKKVIVRSRNEGINAGIVVDADETGIILKDCRRLHYHKPGNKNSAWYEGVAMYGLGDDCRVSISVSKKIIIEDYSITECTDEAFENIMLYTPLGC